MGNQIKFKAKTDVPVLLIFFSRSEQFQSVFDEVKKARPSKLYLYQDGAREGNESDRIGVEKCRATAADENIDWDCEVHRFYQEKNVGCDPSEFIAQKWMFETEEMGIVLEDDDVPSQSFFPFCKELLERYKDDKRVNMICGMNNNDISKHVNASFLFTKKGSIWGWASWKRVLDTWDEHYTWLDDAEKLNIIKTQLTNEEYGFKDDESRKTSTTDYGSGSNNCYFTRDVSWLILGSPMDYYGVYGFNGTIQQYAFLWNDWGARPCMRLKTSVVDYMNETTENFIHENDFVKQLDVKNLLDDISVLAKQLNKKPSELFRKVFY